MQARHPSESTPQQVEEVLGSTEDEEEEATYPSETEKSIADAAMGELPSTPLTPSSTTKWPEPPDVGEVNREAQRLANEAIHRAAKQHGHTQ